LAAHYYRLHEAVTGARLRKAKVVPGWFDLLCAPQNEARQ
jgi:hypothetical protein